MGEGSLNAMNDIKPLEQRLLADIAAACDEIALEAVRVAALGKKGAVSELLKSLGGMSPDERREIGRASCRERV